MESIKGMNIFEIEVFDGEIISGYRANGQRLRVMPGVYEANMSTLVDQHNSADTLLRVYKALDNEDLIIKKSDYPDVFRSLVEPGFDYHYLKRIS